MILREIVDRIDVAVELRIPSEKTQGGHCDLVILVKIARERAINKTPLHSDMLYRLNHISLIQMTTGKLGTRAPCP